MRILKSVFDKQSPTIFTYFLSLFSPTSFCLAGDFLVFLDDDAELPSSSPVRSIGFRLRPELGER